MTKKQQQQQFIELRAKGYTFRQIEAEIGVSIATQSGWLREFDREISNLYNIEMEALYEAARLTKQARLDRFKLLIDKIETQLNERDFEAVDTDKLVSLYLKTMVEIRKEVTSLVIRDEDSHRYRQAKAYDAKIPLHTFVKA